MGSQFIVVLVTVGSRVEAERIARSLLQEKLVACVNILGPVSSHYHWEGRLEHSEEFLLLLKSRQDLFDVLAQRVKELHSYAVPEVVALPVVAGLESYLGWWGSNLK